MFLNGCRGQMNEKLVYTVQEVADLLQLSTSTVKRLVQGGYLPRLQGIKNIRIPVSGVQAYVDGYNSSCVEESKSPTGDKRCISAREKKVYASDKIVRIGGLPTPTQAVNELKSRLALPVSGKR